MRRFAPAAALGAVLWALAAPGSAAQDKDLFGYLERVRLVEPGLEMEAKLDTGADSTSLDATHIRRFRRGKKSYVRFQITDPESGDDVTIERPLVRTTRVKRHSGEHQSRVVVALTVCLGDHLRKVEVSLIDRRYFNYPLLLGRNLLSGLAVVDPSEAFTRDPACEVEDEDEDEDSEAP